jgi:hypothetical protein
MGVEWRESERRSFLTFTLDCEPFLEDVGAMTGGWMSEWLEPRQESEREGS